MSRGDSPAGPPPDAADGPAGPLRSQPEFLEQRRRDAERREGRERGYRRAVLVGLVVSALVHVVLVAYLSDQLRLPRRSAEDTRSPPAEIVEEQRLVQVEEITEPEVPPRPEQAVEPPPPPLQADDTEEAEPDEGEEAPAEPETGADDADELSNAERLKPKEGDGRLWEQPWDVDPGRYLGGSARADSAIRAILGKYFDSLRVAREAYEDAREWTVGEGDERWGVSPDGIHLGDITIPIPVNQLLSPTGPKRRELERELRELRAIQRQETLRDARETREERLEEMRERSSDESDSDSTDSDEGG